jgi:hypothetical protein
LLVVVGVLVVLEGAGLPGGGLLGEGRVLVTGDELRTGFNEGLLFPLNFLDLLQFPLLFIIESPQML